MKTMEIEKELECLKRDVTINRTGVSREYRENLGDEEREVKSRSDSNVMLKADELVWWSK